MRFVPRIFTSDSKRLVLIYTFYQGSVKISLTAGYLERSERHGKKNRKKVELYSFLCHRKTDAFGQNLRHKGLDVSVSDTGKHSPGLPSLPLTGFY